MKVCHIDTETTGVDPRKNGIIQIAGIIDIHTETKAEFNIRLRPFANDEVEDKALEVNGVTREQIAGFPMPLEGKRLFEQTLKDYVNKFRKEDKMWFVGYNGSFDWNMMQEFYRKAGDSYFGSWFQFPVIDTACLAGIMLMDKRSTMPNFKLVTVAKALGLSFNEDDLHDALVDVRLSKAIFDLFMERTGRTGDLCKVANCMLRTT